VALFALLDAAKPVQRSQDLPIADLLTEFQLTPEIVHDIAADELGDRLRALADALIGADRLRWTLVATELKRSAKITAAVVNAAFRRRDDETTKQTINTISLT